MAVWIWLLLLLPLFLAGVSYGLRRSAWTRWLPVIAAVLLLVGGITLVWLVGLSGPVATASGLLRVDALSAWMLVVVGAVAVVALWGGMDRSVSPVPPSSNPVQPSSRRRPGSRSAISGSELNQEAIERTVGRDHFERDRACVHLQQ